MFEYRSGFFAKAFKSVGIECEREASGRIRNEKALIYQGESLRLYFNEATGERGAYFAASSSYYDGFESENWLEARNARVEPNHLKLIPYPGQELAGLRDLLRFVEVKRAEA